MSEIEKLRKARERVSREIGYLELAAGEVHGYAPVVKQIADAIFCLEQALEWIESCIRDEGGS